MISFVDLGENAFLETVGDKEPQNRSFLTMLYELPETGNWCRERFLGMKQELWVNSGSMNGCRTLFDVSYFLLITGKAQQLRRVEEVRVPKGGCKHGGSHRTEIGQLYPCSASRQGWVCRCLPGRAHLSQNAGGRQSPA